MSRASQDNRASTSPSLMRAASDGDVPAVKSLLASGADVDATNQGGQTALMLAALMGNLELVACLLEAGANPQLQDRLGLTALEWSTRRGFSEVSQLLTKVSPPLHGPKPRTASPSARSIETKPQPSILNDLNAERLDRGRKAPSKISSAISDAEVLGKGQALTPQAEAIPFEGPGEAPAVATDSAPSAPTSVAQSQSQRLAVDSALRPPPTTEQPTVADSLPSAPPATPVESQSQRFAVDSALRPPSTTAQPTVTDLLPSAPPATPVESQSQRFAVDSALRPPSTTAQPTVTDLLPSAPPATPAESQSQQLAVDSALRPTPTTEQRAVTDSLPSAPPASPVESQSQRLAVDSALQPTPTTEQPAAADLPPSAPPATPVESRSQQLAVDSALQPTPTTEQPAVADSLASALPATPVESRSQQLAVDSALRPTPTTEQTQGAGPMVPTVTALVTESQTSEPDLGPATAHPLPGDQLLRSEREEEEEEETLTRPRVPAPTRDVTIPKPVSPPALTPVSEPAPTRAAQPPQREHAPAFQASPLGLSTRSTGSDSPEVYHSKRCPKCNTVYQNTPLLYCTRDYATLIDFDPKKETVEEKIQSHSATAFQPVAAHSQSSTPVAVWLLVAFVLGASAFGAYRLTEYFSGAEAPSPVAALPVEAPVETKKPFFSVGGALAGMEVNIPEPEYPAEAQSAGIGGPITVRVRVNRNGRVISAAAAGGDQRLRAAALKAARQATFAPEKLAEVSPRSRVVSGSITYEFAPQSAGAATSPAPLNDAGTGSESGTTSTETGASTAAPNVDPNSPLVDANLTSAAISVPAAEYPSRARRSGTAGTITVTIRVNRAGRVVSWRSSDGDAQLRAAAVKAARKASFSREKLSGSGVVVGTITYNFTP